jgi:hypothetical protein
VLKTEAGCSFSSLVGEAPLHAAFAAALSPTATACRPILI